MPRTIRPGTVRGNTLDLAGEAGLGLGRSTHKREEPEGLALLGFPLTYRRRERQEGCP